MTFRLIMPVKQISGTHLEDLPFERGEQVYGVGFLVYVPFMPFRHRCHSCAVSDFEHLMSCKLVFSCSILLVRHFQLLKNSFGSQPGEKRIK